MADWDWGRIAVEGVGLVASGVVGAVAGAWRWGRKSAKAEQAIKDEFNAKIDKLRDDTRTSMTEYERNATARNDLFVEQFRESFDGMRRQMDQNLLDAERRFLSKPDFDKFHTEYRKDQERTDDKLDRLLGTRQ